MSWHDFNPRPPCPRCQRERDEDMDDQYEVYKLGKDAAVFEASLATDREWINYLDQVAPVVSFRSKPFIDSCHTETL